MILNKSTIFVVPFLMVDETDSETAETGLSPSVQISKNGGSFSNISGSVSEIGLGFYSFSLTTTETDTEGPLIVVATSAGAEVWRSIYFVIDFAKFKADVSSLATTSALSTVDSNVSGIKAKTDNLPASPAAVGSEMALVDGALSESKIGTYAITQTKIASGTLSDNKFQNDYYTELASTFLSVLDTEILTELTGVPPDDATITQMIRWLYMLARNKLAQTNSQTTVYADDGATSVASSSVSDDGTTMTRGEFS